MLVAIDDDGSRLFSSPERHDLPAECLRHLPVGSVIFAGFLAVIGDPGPGLRIINLRLGNLRQTGRDTSRPEILPQPPANELSACKETMRNFVSLRSPLQPFCTRSAVLPTQALA